MSYASWLDVEVRFGRTLTDAEKQQVTAWLEDIESTILARIPNLADLVAAGTLQTATIVKIEAAAVIRVLRNPDGKLVERIDDYSWTRDSSTATGQLGLLDSEWAELTPATASEAFTIRPYYEPPPVWSWGCR
jgi:hypothetical protein